MSQVVQVQPRARGGKLGEVAGAAGAVIGGIAGAPAGPAGAAEGALKGNAIGSLGGNLLDPAKPGLTAPSVESGARGAMARRAASLQPMQPSDYAPELAAAETAASKLPPDLQQQYLPAIQAARQRAAGVA